MSIGKYLLVYDLIRLELREVVDGIYLEGLGASPRTGWVAVGYFDRLANSAAIAAELALE